MTKSKSFLTVIVGVVCLLTFGVLLVGCNKQEPPAVTITQITIDSSTVPTAVKKGSEFVTTDIVVNATKSDKTTEVLAHNSKLSFSTIDTSTVGEKTLTVSYKVDDDTTLTDTATILVYGDLTDITVKSGSYNATGVQGLTYVPGDVVIIATYEGDYTREISGTSLVLSPVDTSTPGEKILEVSYTEDSVTKTDSVTVQIAEAPLTEIFIVEYTQEVAQNEEYDTSNVVVKGRFDNLEGAFDLDPSDYTLSTVDTSVVGSTELTVTYNNDSTKTDTVTVKVYGAVESIQIKEGTIPTSVLSPANFTISNLVIIVNYEGDVSKEISTGFTTNADAFVEDYVGDFTFTVTYEGVSTNATITIMNPNEYTIVGFSEPESISTGYKVNSMRANTFTDTYSGGVKGFTDTGKIYLVGSYNPFKYNPSLQVIYNGQSTGESIYNYPMTATVYLWNEGTSEYDELAGGTLEQYVVFDGEEHTFDFTSSANEKQFKISVLPANLGDGDAQVSPCELEFKVIDGYNIYNVADLSAIDNSNMGGKWTEYKTAHNIPLEVNTNTFILHNDITINRSDIPDIHFWQAGEQGITGSDDPAIGSLKDESNLGKEPEASIYKRTLTEGEDFVLEGNYFTLSAQNIPLIYKAEGETNRDPTKAITTHTCLIAIYARDVAEQQTMEEIQAKVTDGTYSSIEEAKDALIETAEINNIALTGNSNKSEDASLSGGLMFLKADECKITMNNNLSQRWYISYMGQGRAFRTYSEGSTESYQDFNLNKVNAFDSYSTIIYNSARTLNINDCNLIGAGGPVIINDYSKTNDGIAGSKGSIPHVYVDDSSVLQSFVAGTEGWFNTYPAAQTLFNGLKAQNAFFDSDTAIDELGARKTFLSKNSSNVEVINLVAAFKSSEAEDATTSPIAASFEVAGADVALQLDFENTVNYITDLAVMNGMLNDPQIQGGIELVKTQATSAGKTLTTYQAFQQLLLINTEAKSAYDAAYAENLPLLQQAVTQGIIYIAPNGAICMPGSTTPASSSSTTEYKKWIITPNKDLYKDVEDGYCYATVKGTVGAVFTIADVPTTTQG